MGGAEDLTSAMYRRGQQVDKVCELAEAALKQHKCVVVGLQVGHSQPHLTVGRVLLVDIELLTASCHRAPGRAHKTPSWRR